MSELEKKVILVVNRLRDALAEQVAARHVELETDDRGHQDIYRILGVPPDECPRIDLYQNIGRFVYKYAGALLEETTQLLLSESGEGSPISLENTVSSNPRRFDIDCYTRKDNRAHEIKWRDATTDGDHIRKESQKVEVIVANGLVPVRVMFYMPVRAQARSIQERVLRAFREKGHAYVGEEAWDYVKDYSGVNLKETLMSFDVPHPKWIQHVVEAGDE